MADKIKMDPKFKIPDFSADFNDIVTDKILVVEKQDFHVHSAVLNLWSPVFKTMFAGDFKEKDQERIDLPGKKANVFKKFLLTIYDIGLLEKYLEQEKSCLHGIFSRSQETFSRGHVMTDHAYTELLVLLDYLREYQVSKSLSVIEYQLVLSVETLIKQHSERSSIREDLEVYMRFIHLADEFNFSSLYLKIYPNICQFRFTLITEHTKFRLLSSGSQIKLLNDVPRQLEKIIKYLIGQARDPKTLYQYKCDGDPRMKLRDMYSDVSDY